MRNDKSLTFILAPYCDNTLRQIILYNYSRFENYLAKDTVNKKTGDICLAPSTQLQR